jgi:hypothetical protein
LLCTSLHRFNGSFHTSKLRHDHHGQGGIGALHFQPVHARQAQVGENEIDFLPAQLSQCIPSIRRLYDVVAFFSQVQLDQPEQFGFVLNDQNR